jgi:chromatin segregation and condensation protein Rec8/ScpA/Scc1 (kleisin family)
MRSLGRRLDPIQIKSDAIVPVSVTTANIRKMGADDDLMARLKALEAENDALKRLAKLEAENSALKATLKRKSAGDDNEDTKKSKASPKQSPRRSPRLAPVEEKKGPAPKQRRSAAVLLVSAFPIHDSYDTTFSAL